MIARGMSTVETPRPTEPAGTGELFRPVEPARPAEPARSVEPARPAEPARSAEPYRPGLAEAFRNREPRRSVPVEPLAPAEPPRSGLADAFRSVEPEPAEPPRSTEPPWSREPEPEPVPADGARAGADRAEAPEPDRTEPQRTADAGALSGVAGGIQPDFEPANEVEAELLAAANDGQTDNFLSTLLLAKVMIPVPAGISTSIKPGEPGFVWRREQVDGQPYVVVFTSTERITEYLGAGVDTVSVKFIQLIGEWPDDSWSFAVNPGTPVGATLPGAQIRALATWATEVGLTDQPSVEYDEATAVAVGTAVVPANRPVMMQKPVAPSQVSYYLERGYDRVSGFVQRANEVAHLATPEQLYQALGLGYAGSPFKAADEEVYVLRWTAHRPDLYRIPYGGRDEAGMTAMRGWVIERAPFRGNGFAPGESGEVIAEFKVDSARLPHGAQMWRMSREHGEKLIALLDADTPKWRMVGGEDEAGDD
jgi:hypothetical protein